MRTQPKPARRRATSTLLAAAALLATLAGSLRALASDHALAAAASAGPVRVPLDESTWLTDYTGYGRVIHEPNGALVLEPRSASRRLETHAALVRLRDTVAHPLKDFRLTVTARTEAQLRTGARPNPWESLWLFFNYNDAPDGKETNYVAFKTNHIEVGRASSARSQRFLATGDGPGIPVGRRTTFTLAKRGTRLEIAVDGVIVSRFDGARPRLARQLGDLPDAGLLDVPGSIGLYTEDARVRIEAVTLERL